MHVLYVLVPVNCVDLLYVSLSLSYLYIPIYLYLYLYTYIFYVESAGSSVGKHFVFFAYSGHPSSRNPLYKVWASLGAMYILANS